MIRPRRIPKRISFSSTQLKIFKIIFWLSVAFVLVMSSVLLSLMGKNLTYSYRFTPTSIQNQYLKDSYYNFCQIVIIIACIAIFALLPSLIFAAFHQKNLVYFASSSGLLAFHILLCILLLYFLFGNSEYRYYLEQLQAKIVQNYKEYCNESICTVAQCIRVYSHYSARSIVIAYLTINQLGFAFMLSFGYLVNVGRKKTQSLDLII